MLYLDFDFDLEDVSSLIPATYKLEGQLIPSGNKKERKKKKEKKEKDEPQLTLVVA